MLPPPSPRNTQPPSPRTTQPPPSPHLQPTPTPALQTTSSQPAITQVNPGISAQPTLSPAITQQATATQEPGTMQASLSSPTMLPSCEARPLRELKHRRTLSGSGHPIPDKPLPPVPGRQGQPLTRSQSSASIKRGSLLKQ